MGKTEPLLVRGIIAVVRLHQDLLQGSNGHAGDTGQDIDLTTRGSIAASAVQHQLRYG
jgi:hypothetical protein